MLPVSVGDGDTPSLERPKQAFGGNATTPGILPLYLCGLKRLRFWSQITGDTVGMFQVSISVNGFLYFVGCLLLPGQHNTTHVARREDYNQHLMIALGRNRNGLGQVLYKTHPHTWKYEQSLLLFSVETLTLDRITTMCDGVLHCLCFVFTVFFSGVPAWRLV